MGRFAFSIAILSLIGASACETTHAAPMAPLPPERAGEAGTAKATPAHYYRHYPHRYGHHGYPLAGYWNYYRTDWPGRGNSVESTR
jgi:hypothetical protein